MTATTEQLLAAIAAVRHYSMHERPCASLRQWPPLPCTCGLDDTLRIIDAMLAGRDVGKPNGSLAFLASEPDLYDGNHPERPESSTIEDAIDAFQDACHRHAREAILGADDDKPSAALAAHDAKMALIRIIRGDNHSEAPKSSTGDDDGN